MKSLIKAVFCLFILCLPASIQAEQGKSSKNLSNIGIVDSESKPDITVLLFNAEIHKYLSLKHPSQKVCVRTTETTFKEFIVRNTEYVGLPQEGEVFIRIMIYRCQWQERECADDDEEFENPYIFDVYADYDC